MEGVAGVAWSRVFGGLLRLRAFVHLGAGRLVLRGLVADPGGRLGEVLIWGSMPLFVLGVAGGGWFGGTQGLDFLVGVSAA